MCALSNCLLHRVLHFTICKAYIWGFRLLTGLFLSTNCQYIFPFTGGIPGAIEILNINFKSDLIRFIIFILYERMVYLYSLGFSEYSTIGLFILENFNSKGEKKSLLVVKVPCG